MKILISLFMMAVLSSNIFADCTEDTTPPDDVTLEASTGVGVDSAGFCLGGVAVNPATMMPIDVAGLKAYGCEGTTCSTRTEYPAQYTLCNMFAPAVSINGLTAGAMYNFVITAYDACGNETPYSNEVTFATTGFAGNEAPSIPQNLTLMNPTETAITAVWDESTDPENHNIGYNVQYREVGDSWIDLGNMYSVIAYLTNLNPGTNYEVQVRAFDQEQAYSDYSTSAYETTLAASGPLSCTTDTIKDHVSAGRAYKSSRKYYASGSVDSLGSDRNTVVSLSETSTGYYELVGSCQ